MIMRLVIASSSSFHEVVSGNLIRSKHFENVLNLFYQLQKRIYTNCQIVPRRTKAEMKLNTKLFKMLNFSNTVNPRSSSG